MTPDPSAVSQSCPSRLTLDDAHCDEEGYHPPSQTLPPRSLTDPLPGPGHHSPSYTVPSRSLTDPLPGLASHYSPSQTVPPVTLIDTPPGPGHSATAQSSPRMADRRTISTASTPNTQNLGAPPMARLQRVKTSLSFLFAPEHRVGEPPGFIREVKNILFGTCTCCTPFRVYLKF